MTKILDSLERLGLVTRVRPVTASRRSRKTAYEISDQFLRFHYRFVAPAASYLRTRELAREYLRDVVLPQLDHHASAAWEEMCRQHVLRHHGGATEVGRWWGPVPTGDGRRTEEREIDVVAVDAHRSPLAYGMCTWTRRPVDVDELNLLRWLAPHVPGHSGEEAQYLFSRSGFTGRLRAEAASQPRLHLLTPEDLYPS